MKREMAMLEEMVEEGKIRDIDRWDMILAMDSSERESVWKEEGEFDPRRFMAKDRESASQTMLDTIIRMEKFRIFTEIEEKIRSLSGEERDIYLQELSSLQACDTTELAELSLLKKLEVLHERSDLEALSTLEALKSLDDFAECEALRRIDLEKAKQEILRLSQQEHATSEYQTNLKVRPGDVIRIRRFENVEIVQSSTDKLNLYAKKHCWADTQEEAQKQADELEIWTFTEGKRVWIRNSILYPFRAKIDLKLEVPVDVGVIGWSKNISVKDVSGNYSLSGNEISVDGLRGNLSVSTQQIGNINLRNVDGTVEAEAFNALIEIEDCRADVEAKSVLNDIYIKRLRGHCKLRSFEGNFMLNDVCTSHLELKAKNGNIHFDGTVMPGSAYKVETQSGDIEIVLDKYSDCGLTAETQEGKIDWTLPARVGPWGEPNRLYANVRWGSGVFEAVSKSGNIVIKRSR